MSTKNDSSIDSFTKAFKATSLSFSWQIINMSENDNHHIDRLVPIYDRDRKTYSSDTKYNVQVYEPNQGESLPKLPKLAIPDNSSSRIGCPQKTSKFVAAAQGPNEISAWLIPRKLIMGRKPLAVTAEKRAVLSSLGSLLVCGVTKFISLMEETEEMMLEESRSIPSIAKSIKDEFDKARAQCNFIMQKHSRVIDDQKKMLKNIPMYPIDHPDYESGSRHRMKANGKITRSIEGIERARENLKKIAPQVQWLRYPINSASTIEELVVYLELIESYLVSGEVVFVYSREGHGRVGMIAACLLGRLYNLKPYDALFRVQACHDCMQCMLNSAALPVSCPQFPYQRNMVYAVLTSSLRVFVGPTWRSQPRPDEYVDQLRQVDPSKRRQVGISITEPHGSEMRRHKQNLHRLSLYDDDHDHDAAYFTDPHTDSSGLLETAPITASSALTARSPNESTKITHGEDLDTVAINYDDGFVRRCRDVLRPVLRRRVGPGVASPATIVQLRPRDVVES